MAGSADHPETSGPDEPKAGRSRTNNVIVVILMTALAVLGAPLAALIMGAGDGRPTPPDPVVEVGSPGVDGLGNDEVPLEADPEAEPVMTGDARVASLNVLGHSHTTPDGKAAELDEGPKRLRRAVRLLERAEVDVVGLQELQGPQAREFDAIVGDTWGLFHSADDSENAVAWRRSAWAKVAARTVAVPYFNGNLRQMPLIKLRHKESGVAVWFFNVHNPASTAQFPDQGVNRSAANEIERAVVERLVGGSAPVILLGDFNQRAEAFCYFTRGGLLQSGTGEARQDPCQEPAYGGVDWIFGTPDLVFKDWKVRDDKAVGITTDHPLVTVSITLPR